MWRTHHDRAATLPGCDFAITELALNLKTVVRVFDTLYALRWWLEKLCPSITSPLLRQAIGDFHRATAPTQQGQLVRERLGYLRALISSYRRARPLAGHDIPASLAAVCRAVEDLPRYVPALDTWTKQLNDAKLGFSCALNVRMNRFD
jgi:hypothetical protein